MPFYLLQLEALAISIANGVLGGWLYDLIWVPVNVLAGKKRFLMAMVDLLFWLLFTLITYLIHLKSNAGEIRFYNLLGVAGGFFVYRCLFHQPVVKFLSRLFVIIFAFLRFVRHFFFHPLALIYSKLSSGLRSLFSR